MTALSLAFPLLVLEAEPAVAGAPSTVAFFGNSIGHSAELEVRAAVGVNHRVTRYDAVNATTIADHQASLSATVNGAGRPDIVLIELGTNDAAHLSAAQFRHDLREMLATAAPRVDCVRWFDLKPTRTGFYQVYDAHAVEFNRILAAETARYPNVELVHYSAWTTLAGDGYFLGDLLHPNSAGRREFGRLARQAADGCDPTLSSGPFWDVTDGQAIAPAVEWMNDTGVTSGYANRTYRATVGSLHPTLTRGQMARFLWRMAGSPIGYPRNPWSDGPSALDPALDWLAAAGVASGTPGSLFHPDWAISRGSTAGMLWRFAGRPAGSVPSPWRDSTATLEPVFSWLASTGVMTGFSDGTFRPTTALTRGQAALALYRLHVLLDATEPVVGPEPPPGEVSTTTVPPTTVPPTSAPPTTAPPTPTTIPPATTLPE